MKLTKEAKFLSGIGIVIALGVGALALLNKMSTAPPPGHDPPPTMTVAQIDDLFQKSRHQDGSASPVLTFIEFADFECPNCRRAFKTTISDLKTKVPAYRLAFFNLPLPIHERAIPAAEAAEAAAKQNKFWPMYSALFAPESEGLDNEKIKDAAKTAGVDMVKFATDSKDESSLKALVDGDLQVSTTRNIHATPTFYIHDKQGNTASLSGAGNLERLIPDLKDGIIGNDPIAPFDPNSGGSPIQITVGGKSDLK